MKFKGLAFVSALVLLGALATGALAANKGFLWNGSSWHQHRGTSKCSRPRYETGGS